MCAVSVVGLPPLASDWPLPASASSGRDLHRIVLHLSPLRFTPSVQFRTFFSLHRSASSDRWRLPPTKALVAKNGYTNLSLPTLSIHSILQILLLLSMDDAKERTYEQDVMVADQGSPGGALLQGGLPLAPCLLPCW